MAVLVGEPVPAALQESGASVEAVQDLVQEELMRQGYFKAAEAYILYRAKRAQMRLDETPEEDPNQESMVVVTEPDGSTGFWDGTVS